MIDFILWYLSVGFAIYIVIVIKNITDGFNLLKKANLIDLIKGFFVMVPFWVVVLWSIEYKAIKDN